MLSFLRSKLDGRKPYQLLKRLAHDLNPSSESSPGQLLSTRNSSSLSDVSAGNEGSEENVSKRYAELEEFLAAAASNGVFNGKPVKPEEIEKCISIAVDRDILFAIALRINDCGKELRRVVSNVWNLLLKLQHPKTREFSLVTYLTTHPGCISTLFGSYASGGPEGAVINIGVMLRDSLKSPEISRYVLAQDLIPRLFDVIISPNFDVSADAFQTLREALTANKDIGAAWLRQHYEFFFGKYLKLLDASEEDSYVTVRQALNLLSMIILDRAFMKVMLRCVDDEALLKHILMLLSHKSRVIEVEAFHVLKVFVANPKKKSKISKMLTDNTARIVKLLDRIEEVRPDDKEFLLDKRAVVAKLEAATLVVSESEVSHRESRAITPPSVAPTLSNPAPSF